MKGKIFLALSLVLVGAVICAGCISEKEPSIEGNWVLNSNDKITITFNPDGTFGGQAPVNGFGGTYTVDGNKLIIGEDIIQTLIAGSEADMKAEAEFFSALKDVARYQIAENKLILADANDQILFIFTASIVGEWDGADGTSITFDSDGTVIGHAQINSFGGNYIVFGAVFDFENLFMTEMAGPESEMKAEDKFISALNNAASFKIYGNVLVLLDSEGKTLLTFERHFEPLGEWVFSDNPGVTVSFDGDGSFVGQAPVNYFGGKYLIHGASLTFPEGFTQTLMAGSDEMNKAEDEFFKDLKKTAGYAFVDGNLVFLDAKGKVLLTFERVMTSERA